mmetsp:Transcript_30054/g.48293  ORF Transcript_30054/g.48293 Transcript_30054/m.48293 type:complete len:92 (-) Transcript_30054:73-348(-)
MQCSHSGNVNHVNTNARASEHDLLDVQTTFNPLSVSTSKWQASKAPRFNCHPQKVVQKVGGSMKCKTCPITKHMLRARDPQEDPDSGPPER